MGLISEYEYDRFANTEDIQHVQTLGSIDKRDAVDRLIAEISHRQGYRSIWTPRL
jgi:hypothetical protein